MKDQIAVLQERIASTAQPEQWKMDHIEVQMLARLEDWLAYARWIYDRLIDLDAKIHESAFTGEFSDDQFTKYNQDVQEMFVLFFNNSEWMDQKTSLFERKAYQVDHAGSFRDCRKQIKLMFNHPGPISGEMATLRDAAVDQQRAGETVDLEFGEKK